MRKLTLLGLLVAGCLPMLAQPPLCVFQSKNAHYEGSPPEPIKLVWIQDSTGAIQSWDWTHGGVMWYSFAADKGTAKPDSTDLKYFVLNLGITLKKYASTRYQLKGYIGKNGATPKNSPTWPNATFAVIYEGTGTTWFVAHGTLSCGLPLP